ncbi:MAG: TolC family protein [Sulfuritalea sp.]|nr:TolC family protein [Sulfuritalea sp.]
MKILSLGLVVLAWAAGVAHADSLLTFDQVLDASLTQHPAILGKRSARDAASADKEGAEWARYPTPSIEATSGSDGRAAANLVRIDQPLWAGGRIDAGIEVAGSRFDAADAGLDETTQEVSLRVIAAYLEALRQKAREGHAASGVQAHEKLLAMIRRRVTQEVSSQTDQRLAESRLYQTKNELSLVSQSLRNALTQLAQLSGRPVREVSWQALGEQGVPATLDAALESALAASPTLRRLRHEEEAATAEIDQRRSAYMPQVALRFERSSGGGLATDSRALVVLTAQPGAGLSAASGVDAAIARREAARQARDAAERDLRERIAVDWEEWTAARSRLETARLSSFMSDEVFASYERQYVIGRKSWIDVLNAVREATQAQFSAEDARAQSIAAGLRLRAQAGTLTKK